MYCCCFRLQKVVKDLNKYMNSQDKGPWSPSRLSALDRALGEILRVLDKKVRRRRQCRRHRRCRCRRRTWLILLLVC